MEERFLLVGEVATLLRESKSSVYRQYKQGTIPMPAIRTGTLKWLASDIEAFIASQSNRAPPVNAPTATQHRKKQDREYQERHRLNHNTAKHHGDGRQSQ